MNTPIRRTLSLAVAALALASVSAAAQGKGHGKSTEKAKSKHDTREVVRVDSRGTVVRTESRGNVSVPPGLAKKPGNMPPGQYKKLQPREGAIALRDVFIRRGYTVDRITPYGASEIVYYRLPNHGAARDRKSGHHSPRLHERSCDAAERSAVQALLAGFSGSDSGVRLRSLAPESGPQRLCLYSSSTSSSYIGSAVSGPDLMAAVAQCLR